MPMWTLGTVISKELLLKREHENAVYEYAVAVVNGSHMVGHVPRLLSSIIFHFLARPCNKGLAEINGSKIS